MAILAFHKTEPGLSLGINNCKPQRFSALLQSLKALDYQFHTLPNFLEKYDTGEIVSLTFDDGFESFYLNAYPIIRKLSIPATLFMPAGYIGKTDLWDYSGIFRKSRHLDLNQLRELSNNGVEIGSHGYFHTSLTGLSNRLLKIELERSRKKLEDIIGRPVRYISYPFGRFDERVEAMAIEAGYERGFALSSFKQSLTGFTKNRFGIYSIDTLFSIRKKISNNNLERIKGSIINSFASGTILLNKFRPNNILRQD